MKRFQKPYLNSKDQKWVYTLCKVLLTPLAAVYSIYLWAWNTVIEKREKH